MGGRKLRYFDGYIFSVVSPRFPSPAFRHTPRTRDPPAHVGEFLSKGLLPATVPIDFICRHWTRDVVLRERILSDPRLGRG